MQRRIHNVNATVGTGFVYLVPYQRGCSVPYQPGFVPGAIIYEVVGNLLQLPLLSCIAFSTRCFPDTDYK